MTNSGIQIRWMIRRDLPEVVEIERASFEFAWSESDFIEQLRRRDVIGMVAELHNQVVGYMMYELRKTSLDLLVLAVSPQFRRAGIGRAMVNKLISKLARRGDRGRTRITLHIRDSNLDGHLFFRRMGFKAVEVIRSYYKDTDFNCDDDAYVMCYGLPRHSLQGVN